MPGIVAFRRRWSVGSDDLVVPGVFLFILHLIWFVVLSVILAVADFSSYPSPTPVLCVTLLWEYILGYLIILLVSLGAELAICIVAMRGSILDTAPRDSMQYILYVRTGVMLLEMFWLTLGIVWLVQHFQSCPVESAKKVLLGAVICNWLVILSVLVTIWCTFDAAGRSWVKMKQYQRSRREAESRIPYRRSGSNRNWRQRKVMRAYQESWDQRCRVLFCCMPRSDRARNSFGDIARLLSDFFRDLDVVPSDVVAGLVLLRKFQILEREAIVRQRKNDTYDYLSGVAVTPRTQFLALNDAEDFEQFQAVIHFMHFAQGAYGWPMFLYSSAGVCQLCSEMRCGCFPCCGAKDAPQIVDDNCCQCNYAALKRMLSVGEVEVIYATYHVDVGETPFFVAVDYSKRKIVISIRGTLSMKDIITDLNAEGEPLPVDPPREDWLGHKGMVQAAQYILDKLRLEDLIPKALAHNPVRGTHEFGLVIVGHSLGAGTAAILAILMKQEFPSLQCYSYSPPGGLLSMPAVEYSKSFIISVVVGKDVVPRIGLHQMEALRADLINAIQRSVDPKWKTITCSILCCGCASVPTSVVEMSNEDSNINAYQLAKDSARSTSVHPHDATIALTLHNPLYPPGRIIHIVRHHPTKGEQKYESRWRQMISKKEPVYQAVWADNTDFDEVLISPVMIQDHMPDKVLLALNKVITTFGPRKPQRQVSNTTSSVTSAENLQIDGLPVTIESGNSSSSQYRFNSANILSANVVLHNSQTSGTLVSPSGNSITSGNTLRPSSPTSITPPHKLCLETSFTSLQSPTEFPPPGSSNSKTSSVTGSIYCKSKSPVQLNAILNYDFASLLDDSILNRSFGTSCDYYDKNERLDHKLHKNVAFDISDTPKCFPQKHKVLNNKGILHRPRTSMDFYDKTTSGGKVDLIYDDWFGLAPLASPESLSELSSISSRTSLATSIERCLQTISINKPIPIEDNDNYALHTPKVMRRTPKISGNLSTCADDMNSVLNYQKLGQNYNFNRFPSHVESSNSSGDLSFESATSLEQNRCCATNEDLLRSWERKNKRQTSNETSKSFDQIDENNYEENLRNKTQSNNLPACTSQCPLCPCKKFPHKTCCQNYDHAECAQLPDNSNTASSSDTFLSTKSSLTTLDVSQISPHKTFKNLKDLQKMSTEISQLTRNIYAESHDPPSSSEHTRIVSKDYLIVDRLSDGEMSDRKSPISDENSKLLIEKSSPLRVISKEKGKMKYLMKKRQSFDEKFFSKNESLPLLSNLAEKSSPTNFVKRKKYVYPITNIARGESSV